MVFITEYKRTKRCLYRDSSWGRKGSSFFLIRSLWNPLYSVCYTFRIGSLLLPYKHVVFPFYMLVSLYHRWNCYKTGTTLDFGTKIGEGLTIAHYGGIVINKLAVIGCNCVVFQGVTIGAKRTRGGVKVPVIGNNVMLFSGCKILGNVKIGNNVVVGANAVVVKDVPDNAVVAGVPAKIISYNAKETLDLYLSYK